MMEQIAMDGLRSTGKDAGARLDKFLAENQGGYTRSGLERLFKNGLVLVNGEAAAKSSRLKEGDEITILPEKAKAADNAVLVPSDLQLQIIYEDEHIAVVNKAKGMAVHPSTFDETDTLVNALLYRFGDSLSSVGGAFRPGIVHRIDKDTSGLLVIAKDNPAYENLSKQAEAHTMLRKYAGIVCGNPKDDEGVMDAPIGRHPRHRTKYCVIKGGRKAVTNYKIIARYNSYCLVEFSLETGRTHQIRVHMAHLGHPIAGDPVYGKPLKGIQGQCLHAKTLGFTHPATGERLVFDTEPPEYFSEFLNKENF